jgi:hypothetical protein
VQSVQISGFLTDMQRSGGRNWFTKLMSFPKFDTFFIHNSSCNLKYIHAI